MVLCAQTALNYRRNDADKNDEAKVNALINQTFDLVIASLARTFGADDPILSKLQIGGELRKYLIDNAKKPTGHEYWQIDEVLLFCKDLLGYALQLSRLPEDKQRHFLVMFPNEEDRSGACVQGEIDRLASLIGVLNSEGNFIRRAHEAAVEEMVAFKLG